MALTVIGQPRQTTSETLFGALGNIANKTFEGAQAGRQRQWQIADEQRRMQMAIEEEQRQRAMMQEDLARKQAYEAQMQAWQQQNELATAEQNRQQGLAANDRQAQQQIGFEQSPIGQWMVGQDPMQGLMGTIAPQGQTNPMFNQQPQIPQMGAQSPVINPAFSAPPAEPQYQSMPVLQAMAGQMFQDPLDRAYKMSQVGLAQARAQYYQSPRSMTKSGVQAQRMLDLEQRADDGIITPSEQEQLDRMYSGRSGSATPTQQMKQADTLRKEFNQDKMFKNYQLVQAAEGKIKAAYDMSIDPNTTSRVASDQALAVAFQKMLDEDSVVRESEYARTGEGVALINRVESWIPKLSKGGLSIKDEDRRAIWEMADKLLAVQRGQLEHTLKRYGGLADDYNLDPKLVLGRDLASYYSRLGQPTQSNNQQSTQTQNIGISGSQPNGIDTSKWGF